jgi:hypothetical protein
VGGRKGKEGDGILHTCMKIAQGNPLKLLKRREKERGWLKIVT